MKVKTTKTCRRKGCNKVFKLRKTTDVYCSPSCFYSDQKEKPQKQQKNIKPMSEKRKQESYLYTKKRKIFMSKPENKYCPVYKACIDGKIKPSELPSGEEVHRYKIDIPTSEVHHKAGRIGKLLNYVPYWLAVSSDGHKWIHNNPKKSYELGFLIHSSTVNI